MSSRVTAPPYVTSPCLFFFNDSPTPDIYTLSLHDALPIWPSPPLSSTRATCSRSPTPKAGSGVSSPCSRAARSEEHTSELQSHHDLVCRLLLEKKKKDDRSNGLSRNA